MAINEEIIQSTMIKFKKMPSAEIESIIEECDYSQWSLADFVAAGRVLELRKQREAAQLSEQPKIEVPPSVIAYDSLLQDTQKSEPKATEEPEMESAYEESSATNEAKPQFTPSSASDVFFTSAIFGAYFCATLAIGELALPTGTWRDTFEYIDFMTISVTGLGNW